MFHALPRYLFGIGASLLTARTVRRLRGKDASAAHQQQMLQQLLQDSAETRFGQDNHLAAGMSCADFQAQVPLRRYEDFLPYLKRMQAGEADVLVRGTCEFFVSTAGTTGGRGKYLPLSQGMLEHFRQAGNDALLYYTARGGHIGVLRGHQVFLGGAPTFGQFNTSKAHPAYVGDLHSMLAHCLPEWSQNPLHETGPASSEPTDWDHRIAAITHRTRGKDVTLLAGSPAALVSQARSLLTPGPQPPGPIATLAELWPNLECIMHFGAPLDPYLHELRRLIGPKVVLHELYLAAEGLLAVQDKPNGHGLRVLSNHGIFFEFVPSLHFDAARPDTARARACTLAAVEVGVDYVPILTTPGGLTRCVLDDIVRFVSTSPPRLIHLGSLPCLLDLRGEKVTELQLDEAISHLCQRQDWDLVNFHVAPLHGGAAPAATTEAHEWWVELKAGSVRTPIGPAMARALDQSLRQSNPDYRSLRERGRLAEPIVRLVMPGTFKVWLQHHGKWGGQFKMPRSQSQRQIADELAQLSPFSRE